MDLGELEQANRLYERGQYREAANAYLKLLEDAGQDLTGMGQVLHRLGNCFFMEKDYGRALACYDRALKDPTYPDAAKVWFNKAQCFSGMGDLEAALMCYEQVLADPRYTTRYKAHYNKGNALLTLARLEESVEEFKTAAQDSANASPGPASNNAALALMALTRYEEAAEWFGRAAKAPGYERKVAALLHRADAWYAADLGQLALEAYDEARAAGVTLEPDIAVRVSELRLTYAAPSAPAVSAPPSVAPVPAPTPAPGPPPTPAPPVVEPVPTPAPEPSPPAVEPVPAPRPPAPVAPPTAEPVPTWAPGPAPATPEPVPSPTPAPATAPPPTPAPPVTEPVPVPPPVSSEVAAFEGAAAVVAAEPATVETPPQVSEIDLSAFRQEERAPAAPAPPDVEPPDLARVMADAFAQATSAAPEAPEAPMGGREAEATEGAGSGTPAQVPAQFAPPPAPEALAEEEHAAPGVKPFWEQASEMTVEPAAQRSPEEVARAYRQVMSPEETDEFEHKRRRARVRRIVKAIAITLAIALVLSGSTFAVAYFVYDWGVPSREEVVRGSIEAWATNEREKVRDFVVGGADRVIDEYKVIQLPVLDIKIESYERTPGGVRALVVVTSGKTEPQSNLRYAFELRRDGLAWRIAEVRLL